MTRKQTTEERFWNRVDKTESCWLWLGGLTRYGYGIMGIGQRGKRVNAHRFAYEMLVGLIPEGLQIDHLCRVRNCVNPEHLEPVTNAENGRRGVAGQWKVVQRMQVNQCPQGHEFAHPNLYVRPDGARACRECMRAATRRWRARNNNNTNQKAEQPCQLTH